jgi:diacylglycerol kinase (ATP)
MPSENKILLVINPISGNLDKQEFINQAMGRVFELGRVMNVYETSGHKDALTIRSLVEKGNYGTVLAGGGDGTITMIAEALEGLEYELGIIPLGSANGLARSFGIPDDPMEAMETALTGELIPVDAIRLNNDIGLHLSDLGLNALLIKNFESSNLRGKVGYMKEVVKTLTDHEIFPVRITTDSETIETDAVIVIIANAQKYGTGVVINPWGNICDGKFEIVLARKLDFIELARLLAGNTEFDPEVVTIISASRAEIEIITSDIHFQVDGEYKGRVSKVIAEILPAYVRILVPSYEAIGQSN